MADIIDPKYEYDAPVYVDFATVALDQVEDDEADKWFDNRLEDDFMFEDSFNPQTAKSNPPPEKPKSQDKSSSPDLAATNDPLSSQEPTSNLEKTEVTSSTEIKNEPDPDKPEPQSELVTSEGERDKPGTVKLGKRKAGERVNEFLECLAKVKRESGEDNAAISAWKNATEKENKVTKKEEKRPIRDASVKASSNINQILKKPRTPRKPAGSVTITEPKQQQQSGAQQKKTTEQLQLEEVKRLQKEAKKKLQQSRRSYQRLVKSSGPVVVKGSKPTTQAVEFNFHTKERERTKASPGATQKDGVNPTNFPQTLRNFNSTDNYNPNFNATKKPPTPDYLKMKPFKFCLDERFKHKSAPSSSGGSVVPVAEAIQKYQKATPPRFRTNPGSVSKKWKVKANESGHSTASSSSGVSDDSGASFGSKLTVPNTPNLRTKGRSRPVTAKSAQEEEEEVVAQMKEYQFKANPINPDIFRKGGLHGVPRKKTEVHLTEAHTPLLATKSRSLKRKAEEMSDATSEEEDQTAFHAQPMPNFRKVTGVPTKRLMPITDPESPALTLKRRRLNHNQTTDETDEKEETDSRVIRANPLPDLDKVFQPQLPHKKVETKPFSFEERDKNKPDRETFVEMILRKEKKPAFKAQPLPDFGDAPDLPPKAPSTLTEPKPFSLQTEVRGEVHTVKQQEKIEKATQRIKEDAEFKANPATVLHKEPFMPHKLPRPLLTVNNIVLHSELRSEQRAKYDAKRMREEYEKMTENLQRRALRAKEESKELAEYRKQLVHKAQPVHHYTPIVIKPSERPFTQPISPHFHTDERLRSKQVQ